MVVRAWFLVAPALVFDDFQAVIGWEPNVVQRRLNHNTCVVLGHTGRLGLGSHTVGLTGKADKTVTGMEVGNLMDLKKLRARITTGNNVVGKALTSTLRGNGLAAGIRDVDPRATL
jgi:hypothetical protein